MRLSPRMARQRMITYHVFQTAGPTAAWHGVFDSRPVRSVFNALRVSSSSPENGRLEEGKGRERNIRVVAEISNRAGESRLLEASDAPVGLHSPRLCCMCGHHGIRMERLRPRSSFSLESSTIILFIPPPNTSQSNNNHWGHRVSARKRVRSNR